MRRVKEEHMFLEGSALHKCDAAKVKSTSQGNFIDSQKRVLVRSSCLYMQPMQYNRLQYWWHLLSGVCCKGGRQIATSAPANVGPAFDC